MHYTTVIKNHFIGLLADEEEAKVLNGLLSHIHQEPTETVWIDEERVHLAPETFKELWSYAFYRGFVPSMRVL